VLGRYAAVQESSWPKPLYLRSYSLSLEIAEPRLQAVLLKLVTKLGDLIPDPTAAGGLPRQGLAS